MKQKIVALSLELFNAVPTSDEIPTDTSKSNYRQTLKYGVIVEPKAAHAAAEILSYFKDNNLTAEDLNATFHKSWQVIRDSNREKLLLHQLLHYMTTYGTNFTSDFVYLPAESLELPELNKITLRIIKGLPASELTAKCLGLLSSGAALAEATVESTLTLLDLLGHRFDTVDEIKNKEALVRVVAKQGVYPKHPVEFLRYLVYLATESSLLIKSAQTIDAIKVKKLDISVHLEKFGLPKCAEIFHRFKPLWLAFKTNDNNRKLINEISRLARRYHKPIPLDRLNNITSTAFNEDELRESLTTANSFRKARLLNALRTRLNESNTFLYRIRNGTSFSREKPVSLDRNYLQRVYDIVYKDFLTMLNVKGKRIAYPTNVDYALPSSEKMFVGNFPCGTQITAKDLVSGVFWRNDWGAEDLDLSALSLAGKIGWNSDYKGEGVMYSGDICEAPDGATELLYTSGALNYPTLAINNIYSGNDGCTFKIIVGSAPKVEANYMFKPDELILEAECTMVGRSQILGIFLPKKNGEVSFVLVNAGFGSMSVCGPSKQSDMARKALYYQYANPISLRQILIDAKAKLTHEDNVDVDIDLRPKALDKSTILNLIQRK